MYLSNEVVCNMLYIVLVFLLLACILLYALIAFRVPKTTVLLADITAESV